MYDTQPNIRNSSSFVEFFAQCGPKVVLILDDFKFLKEPIYSELLEALSEIKRRATAKCGLHSVVGVGSFTNWQDLQCKTTLFDDHWYIPYFTLREVQQLFTQFMEVTRVSLESGIVEHIFNITNGHPGAVCLIGTKIQNELIDSKSRSLSFIKWINYVQYDLLE